MFREHAKMSDAAQPAEPRVSQEAKRPSYVLIGVRYGIPAAMIIGGVVLAVVGSGEAGIEGFAMAVGGGLSVLLLNVLYRVGVQGEHEREEEDAARAYYSKHGVWPDEPEPSSGRKWVLPAGAVTPEHENRDGEPTA
jgi:hypothetical protein